MKRIAKRTILIAAVLCVLAAVIGGTAYGFFFSARSVDNNVVSTGTIELTLNDNGVTAPVVLTHLMPGDYGTVGNYLVKNIGDTHATLWVGVAGNAAGPFDTGLAQALQVAYWLDRDNDGQWTTGDSYFVPDGRYRSFAAGDDPAVPAAAYNSLEAWNTKWSNTLDIAAGGMGTLRMTYSLPASVDDPALMGKQCNYDLKVELHQYHPDQYDMTFGAVNGHSGATWAAFADGVLVDHGTVGNNGYVITLPADLYTIVFTDPVSHMTMTKRDVDISQHGVFFGDLPVGAFNNGYF